MAIRLVVAAVAVVVVSIILLALFPLGQRPDRSFDVSVRTPAIRDDRVVLFDQAHYNSHSARGGFAPFVRLLTNDGYDVRENGERFTSQALRGAAILVCVNAAGGSNPKLFGINLVPLRKGRRDAPAFTPEEVEAVRAWVSGGGSLLLVADHYPFGTASAGLAAAFGVRMHGGYAEVPRQYAGGKDRGTVSFTRANRLLPDHPITRGRSAAEQLNRIDSFTGQSLDSTAGEAILKLPLGTVEYVPPPPEFKPEPAGAAQGVVLEYGRGRVVVLGEAAMLTAQIDRGERFGMNLRGIDNRQFVLNVVHWLSHVI